MRNDVWVDAEGTHWRPEDMTPSHRANALKFAERHAVSMYRRWLTLTVHEAMAILDGDLPDGVWSIMTSEAGRAMDELDLEVHGRDGEFALHAMTWLNEQPVIMRLRELVAEDRANRTIAANRLREQPQLASVGWWESPGDFDDKENHG